VQFKNESFIYHASLKLQWTATCDFNFRMRKYAQCDPRLSGKYLLQSTRKNNHK